MVPAISLTVLAVTQCRLVGQEREPQLDAVGVGLDLGPAAGVSELGQVGGGGLMEWLQRLWRDHAANCTQSGSRTGKVAA